MFLEINFLKIITSGRTMINTPYIDYYFSKFLNIFVLFFFYMGIVAFILSINTYIILWYHLI